MLTHTYRTELLMPLPAPLERALNDLAEDGWRLISLTPYPPNHERLLGVFERENSQEVH